MSDTTNSAKIGEFGFINRIARHVQPAAAVAIGIGDDAAAIHTLADHYSLITTDMLVEGIHFDLSYTDANSLGRKAVSVNLSDIAAMGGIPQCFLLAYAVPAQQSLAFMEEVTRAMIQCAAEYGVTLVGGDTCAAPDRLVISITMIGKQLPDRIIRRTGALPGDHICVTGTLGDSALGLRLLRRGERHGPLVQRHLDPTPRVRFGALLAQMSIPTAMIDISDGLLADLGHILEQSSVGAHINQAALPLSAEFRACCTSGNSDALLLALSGGEDYELLFTVSPENMPALVSLAAQEQVPVTTIGTITADRKLAVFAEGGEELTVHHKGFDHFSETVY